MVANLPDLAAEIVGGDSITILDVTRQFAVSPSTAFRWIQRGLPDGRGGRIRLQAIRRGKIWLTSRAALERFLGALPSAGTPVAPIRTPAKRDRESARAQQTLADKYGI